MNTTTNKTTDTTTNSTASTTADRGRRNTLTGKVVADKNDKTISVMVYNSVRHPKYKKYIKKSSVFKAHDEDNKAKLGDVVRIVETRALSKTKRWKLLDFVTSSDLEAQNKEIDNPLEGLQVKQAPDTKKMEQEKVGT